MLAKWHVAVGDTVKAGDVIAEIETDKATMEVEAVDEGVISALLVAAPRSSIREASGHHYSVAGTIHAGKLRGG